jgi:hypothetical protein
MLKEIKKLMSSFKINCFKCEHLKKENNHKRCSINNKIIKEAYCLIIECPILNKRRKHDRRNN